MSSAIGGMEVISWAGGASSWGASMSIGRPATGTRTLGVTSEAL